MYNTMGLILEEGFYKLVEVAFFNYVSLTVFSMVLGALSSASLFVFFYLNFLKNTFDCEIAENAHLLGYPAKHI